MSAPLASQQEPLPGYKLLERLGRGGFGEVWKVEAPGGLHKAMKFVFGDLDNIEDENIRAAEQEMKSLERVKNIRHPYILSLEQWKVVQGQLIIVMELADCNLWDRFKICRGLGKPGIPREELLGYLTEAAEALDLMNTKFNIQHLDVKPQNLFLILNHVKVADFGLVKTFEGNRGTVTGGVTPVYAGPETFEGYVSRYTDQYSLAIVFQELLTGTRPFNGANTKQLVMQHLNGTPDLEPIPASDRPIIARALSKKPEDRWPSCMDMVKALKAPAAPTPVATPVATPVPTPAPAKKSSVVTDPNVTRRQLPAPPATEDRATRFRTTLSTPGVTGTKTPPSIRMVPQLVTPQNAAANAMGGLPAPAMTLQRPLIVQTARMGTNGLLPVERKGSGVLVPALIVGIGQTGLMVLRALKSILHSRFGAVMLPHLRFLYVDTDSEGMNLATQPGTTEPLVSQEVLINRLNRPAHYLQHEWLAPVEQWMPPGLLYKLPRNAESTGGVRAFGRLALMDGYKALVTRLKGEFEALNQEVSIDAAVARTGLGLRFNRTRAYIIANLAGGTGSGMFLDLAYLLRNELRQCGYIRPETMGQLLVPPADSTNSRTVALANTYAALTELHQFHQGRNRYATRFENNRPPISDTEGPLTRCNLTQLPQRNHPHEIAKVTGLVARSLFLELFTPMGRVADEVRDEAMALNRQGAAVVQSSGIYRLSWPRHELLTIATQRFGLKLLQRWTSKDTPHLREPIQNWLNEQWTKRKLDLEVVVESFETTVREALREEPDRVFHAFIDPLRQRSSAASRLDFEAVWRVLDQLVKLVGQPEIDAEHPASLHNLLMDRFPQVAAEAESHLSVMAVALLEQPQYRLSGAEEAVQQILDRLKRTVSSLESVRKDLFREVYDGYVKLLTSFNTMTQAGALGVVSGRKATATVEVLELLDQYPRKRLRLLILDATLAVYRGMVASVPEYVREIGMCRSQLLEIHAVLSKPPQLSQAPSGPGRMILPQGVEGLDGAADMFLGALPVPDILEFETTLQNDVAKKFRSLVTVCVKTERQQPFLTLLNESAFRFLDARLDRSDPAAVFFRYRSDNPEPTKKMLVGAFEEAAPDLTSRMGQAQTEMTILACPTGTEGERFRDTVQGNLPEVQFLPAPLPDDIVFWREYPILPLAELPQLADNARAAYLAQMNAELTPHTRSDIPWSLPTGS